MKFAKWLSAIISTLLLFAAISQAQEDEDSVKLLSVTPGMDATAASALQGCQPIKGKPVGAINKNGVYTLTGDFFNDGRIYAILDRNPILICEWRDGQWKVTAALSTSAVWNYPGWDPNIPGPDATIPFWMISLEHRPLLVIASDVEKVRQNYSIILFDTQFRSILDSDYSFGKAPEVAGDFLVCSDAARGRGGWEGTYFSKIQNDKFKVSKSWEDSSHPDPNSDTGDEDILYTATSGSDAYDITDHPTGYEIRKGKAGQDSTEHDVRFGKVDFVPRNKKAFADSNLAEEELAYLFTKLTGLPRNQFPEPDRSVLNDVVEKREKIRVTGVPEAVKLLSPVSRGPASPAKP